MIHHGHRFFVLNATEFCCLGAESYEVRMKIDDSADDPSSYTTEETRFTVTNLVAGRFYDFAVVAIGIRNKRNPQQSDGISLQTGM